MQTIDAILMASGLSRRFPGGDKLLAPFRGAPLASHALHLYSGMGVFRRVILVCANRQVARLAQALPIDIVDNLRPELGQRESIRLGALASRADGLLFCPCDQPLMDEDTVSRIVAGGRAGRIAVPTCDGQPGAPVLFSRAFAGELMALADGETGKAIMARHPRAVDFIPVANPLAFCDVDTPDDLLSLEQM